MPTYPLRIPSHKPICHLIPQLLTPEFCLLSIRSGAAYAQFGPSCFTLCSNACFVAALAKGSQGIQWQVTLFSPFDNGRPDIGEKGLFEAFLGVDLLVAFLVVVELSYRQWIRRLRARQFRAAPEVDLTAPEAAERDAAIVALPVRPAPQRPARRSG